MHHVSNISNLTRDNLDQIIIEGTDWYAFIQGQGRGDGNRSLLKGICLQDKGTGTIVLYFFDRYYGPVNSDVALNYFMVSDNTCYAK